MTHPNPPVLPGKYIVIEGIDGTGKSTVTTELGELLMPKERVVITREPFHKKWREIVSLCDFSSPMSIAALMTAFRMEHYEKVVMPALRDGKVVISDRGLLSTFAYQGTELPKDIPWPQVFSYLTYHSLIGYRSPDLVILLDTPNHRFLKDRVMRRDPSDIFPSLERFNQIRKGYLDALGLYKDRNCVIPITEKNGDKRSLQGLIDDIAPHLKKIGIFLPHV